MKKRSAHDVAGIGPLHAHLGRFAKAKHLNRGHNSDPIADAIKASPPFDHAKAQADTVDEQVAARKKEIPPYSPTGRVVEGVVYTPARIREMQRERGAK